MFPRLDESPLSLRPFSRLQGVADAVYNPLRSSLVLEARERSVPALGSITFTIIFTNDFGVKKTPSSEATAGANLLRKYS